MQKPTPGHPVDLARNIRLLLAPNPGPMTHWGTNTYLLGNDQIAVIDPGPDNDAHFQAILDATKGATITHILVTHAHADHSPLAARLSQVTSAPVMGFGPAEAGRSDVMQRLAQANLLEGGEGVDTSFRPDMTLRDGDVVEGTDWHLGILHTPGHFAGHLSFAYGTEIFSGDHVMDWASTLISPPDGDLGAFMATCHMLKERNPNKLFPGHGAPIVAVKDRLAWLISHRKARETAILKVLKPAALTVTEITAQVYTDVPPKVLPAAARNVFAHLIDLVERKLITASPELSTKAQFHFAKV
ncbi:MAG: MBL fold metallo-hydrolase [Paracoccaceae bacterium]